MNGYRQQVEFNPCVPDHASCLLSIPQHRCPHWRTAVRRHPKVILPSTPRSICCRPHSCRCLCRCGASRPAVQMKRHKQPDRTIESRSGPFTTQLDMGSAKHADHRGPPGTCIHPMKLPPYAPAFAKGNPQGNTKCTHIPAIDHTTSTPPYKQPHRWQ